MPAPYGGFDRPGRDIFQRRHVGLSTGVCGLSAGLRAGEHHQHLGDQHDRGLGPGLALLGRLVEPRRQRGNMRRHDVPLLIAWHQVSGQCP